MNGKMVTSLTALACALCAVVAAPASAVAVCGWYVDVAGHVAPMFAVVGEVSGAYKSETMAFGTSSVDATVRLHTFMGGVRVAARTKSKVVPFGQLLLGERVEKFDPADRDILGFGTLVGGVDVMEDAA